MRRIPLLIALAALLVGVLAVTATVDAKKKKRPFRTGQFVGTLVSNPVGVPPTEKTIRPRVQKIGSKFKVGPDLGDYLGGKRQPATVVTCGPQKRNRAKPMIYPDIVVSKKTGKFSGRTLSGPGRAGGRIKGKVKRSKITGTWSFNGSFDAAPDAETCTGSGTFTAKRQGAIR